MNTTLYNDLCKAKTFLDNCSAYDKQIDLLRSELIKIGFRSDNYKNVNTHSVNPINWRRAIFLLILFWPAGLLYINHKKKISERALSTEPPKHDDVTRQKLHECSSKRNRLIREREIYYNTHFTECVGFLPEKFRDKKSVESLIRIVESGCANTKNDAFSILDSYRAKERLELNKLQEEFDAREESRRRHKEQIDALDKIASNQEEINRGQDKIIRELEKRNQYIRRW